MLRLGSQLNFQQFKYFVYVFTVNILRSTTYFAPRTIETVTNSRIKMIDNIMKILHATQTAIETEKLFKMLPTASQ